MENEKNMSLNDKSDADIDILVEDGVKQDITLPYTHVSDSIDSLSTKLTESITQLDANLSTLLGSVSVRQLLFGLLVAIVGAFSAYVFNYFHWKMVEDRQKISNLYSILITLIKELELTATEYWLNDYENDKQTEIEAAEISIKSNLRLIRKYTDNLPKKIDSSSKQDLKDFIYDIYDITTGDDFESKKRKKSKQIASQISRECSDVRAKIISLDFTI